MCCSVAALALGFTVQVLRGLFTFPRSQDKSRRSRVSPACCNLTSCAGRGWLWPCSHLAGREQHSHEGQQCLGPVEQSLICAWGLPVVCFEVQIRCPASLAAIECLTIFNQPFTSHLKIH